MPFNVDCDQMATSGCYYMDEEKKRRIKNDNQQNQKSQLQISLNMFHDDVFHAFRLLFAFDERDMNF